MNNRYISLLLATFSLAVIGVLGVRAQNSPTVSRRSSSGAIRSGQDQPTGSAVAFQGAIIGNKATKVYHMPGDRRLPMEKNRVYFRSELEAKAAGYRPAKVSHGKKVRTLPARHPKTGRFIKSPPQ